MAAPEYDSTTKRWYAELTSHFIQIIYASPAILSGPARCSALWWVDSVVAAGGDPAVAVKAPGKNKTPGKKQGGEKKFTVGDILRELGVPVLN